MRIANVDRYLKNLGHKVSPIALNGSREISSGSHHAFIREERNFLDGKMPVYFLTVDPKKIKISGLIDPWVIETANNCEGSYQNFMNANWKRNMHPMDYAKKLQMEGREVIGICNGGNIFFHKHDIMIINSELFSWLDFKDAKRSCFIVDKTGQVDIAGLHLKEAEDSKGMNVVNFPLQNINLAVFGQYILKDGKIVDISKIANEFTSNLRQLFRLPQFKYQIGKYIMHGKFLGHDQLVENPHLLTDAFLGPIMLNIPETVQSKEDLSEALFRIGYSDLEYSFNWPERSLNIGLRRSTYPHTALGINKERSQVIVAAFPGALDRSGILVEEAAETLRLKGCHNAILLGNGGDVALYEGASGNILNENYIGRPLPNVIAFTK